VDEARVLELLARADRASFVPRLGGMARPDGVVIVSERYWALAGRAGLRTGAMPRQPRMLRHVPFVRGLARLASSLAPVFKGRAAASPRVRALLGIVVLASVLAPALPSPGANAVMIAVALAMLAVLFRGRTLSLHGAEHRAITAAETRRLVATWHGEARPSRFSPRCGTNFAAIAVAVTAAVGHFWSLHLGIATPAAVTIVSLALSMEIWLVLQRSAPLGRIGLAPGLALQRLTTREPSLTETRVALTALAAVLQSEEERAVAAAAPLLVAA
jgi:uncharacterized protein YqhQ